jgi:uncharacterized protein YndB with AHSA1/START domain
MLHIDAIERELILPAAPDDVWAKSFGSPEALASWFPQSIEGDYRLGGSFYLIWGEHRSQALMTEFDPGRALAYQWHPGDAFDLDSHPREQLTTVRFTLEAVEEGTMVRMVESGFSSIGEDRRAWALEQNTGGWDEELAKLPQGYAA